MEIYVGLGGRYKISIEDRVGQHHQLVQLTLHSRKTRTITCKRKCCKPSIVLKKKIYKLWETPIWWLLLKPNWKIQSHHVHRDCAYPGNFDWNKLADNHGEDGKTLELILTSQTTHHRADFLRTDFTVDKFFIEQSIRETPLDNLRDDLGLYLKVLRSSMIELINQVGWSQQIKTLQLHT